MVIPYPGISWFPRLRRGARFPTSTVCPLRRSPRPDAHAHPRAQVHYSAAPCTHTRTRVLYTLLAQGAGALAWSYSVGGSSPSRCAFSIIDVITYLFTDRPAFFAHFWRLFLFAGLFFCIFTDTISSALSSYFLFARFFASDMDICFTALYALVTGINNPLFYTGYRCFLLLHRYFLSFFKSRVLCMAFCTGYRYTIATITKQPRPQGHGPRVINPSKPSTARPVLLHSPGTSRAALYTMQGRPAARPFAMHRRNARTLKKVYCAPPPQCLRANGMAGSPHGATAYKSTAQSMP